MATTYRGNCLSTFHGAYHKYLLSPSRSLSMLASGNDVIIQEEGDLHFQFLLRMKFKGLSPSVG